MSVGGAASSGNSNQTTELDPQIKGDWQDVFNNAWQTSNGSTPQQQVAGFTPAGILGQNMTLGAAGAGLPQVAQASDAANGVANYQAPTVYNDTSLGTPDSGMLGYPGQTVTPTTLASTDLTPYLNPYTSDVVNTSLNQLDLQRQRDINGNSSAATMQGGEGADQGSRAGVSDALTNEEYGNLDAQTIAQLNSAGFTGAQGAAAGDIANNLQGQLANQGTGLAQAETKYGGTLTTNLANQNAVNTMEAENAANANTAASIRATGSGVLGNLGAENQDLALTGANAVTGVGAAQQGQQQDVYNTAYQNAMTNRNLPLQTEESVFGIIPTTANGSSVVSNSSGKSGNAGIWP